MADTPSLKVQLEFNLAGVGFSEVYYCAGSVPLAAQPQAISMARERLKALVPAGRIHHIRISGTTPGARSFRFPLLSGAGNRADAGPRDVGNVTNTIGVYTESGVRRSMKFHGCPDRSAAFGVDGIEDTTPSAVLTAFIDYLILNQWQIRHQAVSATLATVKIGNITVAASGVVSFECNTAGFVPGKKIRVSSCQGYHASQFNGVWTVGAAVVGPPAALTCATRRLIDPNYYYAPSTGSIRDQTAAAFVYPAIKSQDNYQVAGTRKTGRPTDAPRGRVSSRR